MKQLILVAAPPAHGKDFVAKRICERVHGTAYLDKDALAPLLHRAFALAGERVNMDGAFYRDNLRDAEYETLVSLALSALEMTMRPLSGVRSLETWVLFLWSALLGSRTLISTSGPTPLFSR